jgi:dihydroorotate dehydrogenase electron transfer subunit
MRAKPLRVDSEVVSNTAERGVSRRLVLRIEEGWPDAEPGQFLMLSPGIRGRVERYDPLLPRPMAIFRSRRIGEAAEVQVLYKVVGRGTSLLAEVQVLYKVVGRGTSLLADARPGEEVRLVGPLGRGFPEPARGERVILVGGGTGIASLFELALRSSKRARISVLLGARTAADLMGRADFESLDANLQVATDDGSDGAEGLVTELLERVIAREAPARVYACGPTPMMRRAAEIAGAAGLPCLVSLENRMACGFGICLGCAVPRSDEGYHLVCRDGPVFESGDLSWEGVP